MNTLLSCCIVVLQIFLALSLMVVIPELQRLRKLSFEGPICYSNNLTPFSHFPPIGTLSSPSPFLFLSHCNTSTFLFKTCELFKLWKFYEHNPTAIPAIFIYSASPKGGTDEKDEIREQEGISDIFTISNLSNAVTGFIYVCINLYLPQKNWVAIQLEKKAIPHSTE